MFEHFYITDHIIERYQKRVSKNKKDCFQRIKNDLNFKKVKRIVNIGSHKHVFTIHSKEFIFERKGNAWVLKTIIKYNRETFVKALNKKMQLAA